MDAKLRKIQVTPMKFSKDGEIQKEEFATVTFEIPLVGIKQREELVQMFELLAREWVVVEVSDKPILREAQPGGIA